MFLILKNKKLVLLGIILVSFLFLVSGKVTINAQETTGCVSQISGLYRFENCRVNASDSLIIKAEGCEYGNYQVLNETGEDIFIPTRTCSEWDSFLLYHPSGVSLDPCANIVFNAYSATSLNATNETPFINQLKDWGYNVTVVSDADMATYDFSNTDLLVIRGRDTYGAHSYGGSLLGLTVPIISMDRYVSGVNFGMATASELRSSNYYYIFNTSHPFSSGYSGSVTIYTSSAGMQRLSSLTSGVTMPIGTLNTASSTYPGVAIRSAADYYPRIHWAAHRGSYLNSDGWNIFQNVIEELIKTSSGNVYSLTVSKTGLGSGTVTSNPAGITCGSTCFNYFPEDQTVTLTASPATGHSFAGWSGACSGTGTCVLSMTENRSVTANFSPPATLTVNYNPIVTGGSCSPSSRTVNYGSSAAGPSCTASGYDCIGFGISSGSCASGFDSSTGYCGSVTANLTIRAYWREAVPPSSAPSVTCWPQVYSGNDSILVAWSSMTAADYYDVWRYAVDEYYMYYVKVGTTTDTTTWRDYDLVLGNNYRYFINPCNIHGCYDGTPNVIEPGDPTATCLAGDY